MAGRLLSLSLLTASCAGTIVPQFSGKGRLTGSNFGIPGQNATYDYVIVGGGLAGSVVAARLTEHSNATVALVEAGSFYELVNGNWSQIPYWSEQWVGAEEDDWQPLIDWGLFTEPQVNGKKIHYAQGKSLGGSSARNQMMYHRPTVGAYQKWADQVGDQSYTWANMTKYMQRSMHFDRNVAKRAANVTPAEDFSAYSSEGGPLHVSYPAYANPLGSYGPAAFSSVGQKDINSFSAGRLDGWAWWPFTIDPSTGLRSSSQATFLAEAFERPTLTTYVNSHVNNIIFNGTNKAMGVNVTNNGMRPFHLTARKEVIVSAGAYHSPQLLMVSGIGPKETLDKYNITVVKDAPGVGQNMWDSCNVGGVVYEISLDGYTTWQQPMEMLEAQSQLLTNASGPLTNIGLDMGNFYKVSNYSSLNLSSNARKELSIFPADWPEVENSFASSARTLTASSAKKQYGSIGNVLVATTSRGNMTIRSASNLDSPIINPNWLRSTTDQEVAVQAYKLARKMWDAIPDGIKIGEESFPGKNVTTDAQLLEAIMGNLSPIHHASSSCAMGKESDAMAVVDSKARVFGVENLRVIDSSSFPFTPPGHTQGVTYAHAEKLVEDVLDDWNEGMGMEG